MLFLAQRHESTYYQSLLLLLAKTVMFFLNVGDIADIFLFLYFYGKPYLFLIFLDFFLLLTSFHTFYTNLY